MTSPGTLITTPSWPRSWPRFATPRDPGRPTRGPEILAHLTRLRRSAPYRWQWDLANVAGELNDDLTGFRYRTVVVSVPRRAGKSTLVLGVNLAALDALPDARCWYTANRRETAAKLFRDEWAPMVERQPTRYRLRKSQGSEGIHKRRGSSRLQLFAPNADALHSTNADTVTVDEAWALDLDQGEAVEAGITPAQLTRPWRQTWIVSAGGTIESTWWDRWLLAGEAATPGVALFDWGADAGAEDYDPASPATWAGSHPTAGVAFPLDVLAHEWAVRADDASFERAYLNVWPRPSAAIESAGLELAQWSAAARPDDTPAPVTAIALDVAGDRSTASLAIAGPSSSTPGAFVVEVVDNRPGVGWLAAAVRARRAEHRGAALVADSLVAASVVAELQRARVTVDPVGAGDHARACGTFVDHLAAGDLHHRAQLVLDDAVAGAARRPLGDAWLWSRSRSTVDISPLVAVTLAHYAARSRRAAGKAAIVVANRHDGIRADTGVRPNGPSRGPTPAQRRNSGGSGAFRAARGPGG